MSAMQTKQFVHAMVLGVHDWLVEAGYYEQLAWDIAASIVKAQYRTEAARRCSDELAIDLAVVDEIRDDYRAETGGE